MAVLMLHSRGRRGLCHPSLFCSKTRQLSQCESEQRGVLTLWHWSWPSPWSKTLGRALEKVSPFCTVESDVGHIIIHHCLLAQRFVWESVAIFSVCRSGFSHSRTLKFGYCVLSAFFPWRNVMQAWRCYQISWNVAQIIMSCFHVLVPAFGCEITAWEHILYFLPQIYCKKEKYTLGTTHVESPVLMKTESCPGVRWTAPGSCGPEMQEQPFF